MTASSIPLDVALACMLTSLFAILILVLVVIVNITEIHSGVLWIVLGGGFGSEILIYWLVWYLHRKGWVLIKSTYSLAWVCADYILDCIELPSVIIKNNGLTLDLSLGQTILYIASNKLRLSQ